MSRAAFVRLAGGRVAHVTARANLGSIRARGLQPAADLARLSGVDPATLALRRDRRRLPCGAILNHQRPIAEHQAAARRMLDDGHSPESWAEQLDRRVFFWPARRGAAFAASVARDVPTVVLWLDAGGLYDAAQGALDLAPANSGNFAQGGAHLRRGDWLYVPATRAGDFATMRQARGLVQGRDTLREISLRGGQSAGALAALEVPAP